MCREFPGTDSSDTDILEEEGEWGKVHIIIIGYEMNIGASSAKLPDAKICGAWDVLRGTVFKHGNRIIPERQVQMVIGLINHWARANRFWEYMVAPYNALLGYVDETNTWILCENDQSWIAVRNLSRFPMRCSEDGLVWNALFFRFGTRFNYGSYEDYLPRTSLPCDLDRGRCCDWPFNCNQLVSSIICGAKYNGILRRRRSKSCT